MITHLYKINNHKNTIKIVIRNIIQKIRTNIVQYYDLKRLNKENIIKTSKLAIKNAHKTIV